MTSADDGTATPRRLRILLVHDHQLRIGGAEVMTFALRDEFRLLGHDARVFASQTASPDASFQADYQCYGTLSRSKALLETLNPWAYFSLRRVLKEFRPDVVHVRMFFSQLSPLILPLLRRIPALHHVVMYRPLCFTGTKNLPDGSTCRDPSGLACYRNRCVPLRSVGFQMFQMWLWRRWGSVFKRTVANSEALRESLEGAGISPVEVIHNGVELTPMGPGPGPRPVVVFAGRLIREKGVDALIRAFAIVVEKRPEARLLIAGDGIAREALTRLTSTLGLGDHVTFLGQLDPSEMETRFAGAWVQVVPSRWAEPFGLVAIEGMRRGTAVIASAMGGLREIVEHGRTGFLVPPDDPQALAGALMSVLSDPAKAAALGRAGREVVGQRFTLSDQCRRFLSLYEQMIAERP